MKIIHLINEEKITLSVIEAFETVSPNENLYVIFKKKNSIPELLSLANVVYSTDFKPDESLEYEKIFIHFLDIRKVIFIEKKLDLKKHIYWFIWGGDIYNRPEIGFSIFSKQTISLLFKIRSVKEFVRLISNPIRGNFFSMGKIKRFTPFITNLVTSIDGDVKLVNNIFHIKAKQSIFNYYSISDNLEPPTLVKALPNILLGNSGHPTNNHTDVLKHLANNDTLFNNIYVPLNYGDTKYISALIDLGTRILGEKFIPLTTFIPLEAYNKILSDCDLAIFNSFRQQAFGNIISLLSLGKTIYLNRNNSIYEYLVSNGFSLFEMSEIDWNLELKLISEPDRLKNIEIAKKLFSKATALELVKKLINE